MPKSETRKRQKPASSSGVPVLSILFGLLFAALLGVGGWLYWADMNKDHTSLSAASTDISPPQPAGKEQPAEHDSEKKEEDHQPSSKDEEKAHSDPQAPEITPAPPEIAKETDHQDAEEITEAIKETSPPTASKPLDTPTEEKPIVDHKTTGTETPESIQKPIEAAKEPVVPPAQEKTAETPVEPDTAKTAETKEPEKPAKQQISKEQPEKTATKPEIKTIAPPEKATPLAPAPDPELTKNSDFGLLPVVGPTGRQPWRIYARPFDDPLDRPRIAIIISEMGMSTSATRSAIQNLQGSVSLSFNPYARDLQNWIGQARAAGHEVLLQLPMEPFGYPKNDPGPHSLLTSLTDRENLNRLDWMLGRFTGYSGVTNQMGSKFTAKADYIRPVLEVIKSRGLLFVDGRTSAKSVAGQLAAKIDMPVAINNRFLDHKADRGTIDARLKDLERIARYTGTAVGIGYPYPVTLERIAAWSQTLARKGYVLAPVSAVINRQEIQ